MYLANTLVSFLGLLSTIQLCAGAAAPSIVETFHCGDGKSDRVIRPGDDFRICVATKKDNASTHIVNSFNTLICSNGFSGRAIIENGVPDETTTLLSDVVTKAEIQGIGLQTLATSTFFTGFRPTSITCEGSVNVDEAATCKEQSFTFPTTDYLPMKSGTNGMIHGLCVMGATSASASLSPNRAGYSYKSFPNFRDGMGAFGNYGVRVSSLNGKGPTFCEGGIFLQPGTIQGPPSGEDITVTAIPIDGSDGVTICAALDRPWSVYNREGNWKQPLLDQGFTASKGGWTYHPSYPDRMITYCKTFEKKCPVEGKTIKQSFSMTINIEKPRVEAFSCQKDGSPRSEKVGIDNDFKVCVGPTVKDYSVYNVTGFEDVTCKNKNSRKWETMGSAKIAESKSLVSLVNEKDALAGVAFSGVVTSGFFSKKSTSMTCEGTVAVEKVRACEDPSFTFPTTDYLPMKSGTNGMIHGLCVMGATSASASLSPNRAGYSYKSFPNFRDGMGAFGNYGARVSSLNGKGPTFCEGGIFLQPGTIQGPPSGEDITVTAIPIDGSDSVTICAALDRPWSVYNREGNWKQPLLDQGFTASKGGWTYHPSYPDRMITYCKTFEKKCPVGETTSVVSFSTTIDLDPPPATSSPTSSPSSSPTNSPTTSPTMSPTVSPTASPTLSPTSVAESVSVPFPDDIALVRTKGATESSPAKGLKSASGSVRKVPCLEDILLVKTDGVTKYQPAKEDFDASGAVNIVSQDKSTVTVELVQAWNSPIEKIFYQYKADMFEQTCIEEDGTQTGITIGKITLQCNLMSPIAYLKICLQDNTSLALGDRAIVPKCCQSDAPQGTPTVCYNLEIACKTKCGTGEEASQRLRRRNLSS